MTDLIILLQLNRLKMISEILKRSGSMCNSSVWLVSDAVNEPRDEGRYI